MEKHFLSEFVEGEERLEPGPWYNPDGDCIIYQIADEAIIADRIDNVLTIYRSAITEKAIGYQIKGVGALMGIFGLDGMLVESTEDEQEIKEVGISLYRLLLAAYEQGPKTIGRRRAYADAFESSASHPRTGSAEVRIPSMSL
jgi:hypothetical protein